MPPPFPLPLQNYCQDELLEHRMPLLPPCDHAWPFRSTSSHDSLQDLHPFTDRQLLRRFVESIFFCALGRLFLKWKREEEIRIRGDKEYPGLFGSRKETFLFQQSFVYFHFLLFKKKKKREEKESENLFVFIAYFIIPFILFYLVYVVSQTRKERKKQRRKRKERKEKVCFLFFLSFRSFRNFVFSTWPPNHRHNGSIARGSGAP